MRREQTILQVSDLADQLRRLVEASYPEVWIEGELSSLSTPASGHLYFTLKDEKAQLRCAMFKGRAGISKYRPQAGDLVRVRAKLSVYSARGDLQCIVQHIEEAGEGLLQRRFEELKAKLAKEGLFANDTKLAIPSFPKHIGVITSPSGAAVRDILSTLARRCPGIPVTIYPAVVQGDSGAASILKALRQAISHAQADVLILSRGGGSLEDLWCFNHEDVARAIYSCPIPLISGVGHEVDVTISDLVADLRAPTPTAAAELLSPDQDLLNEQLQTLALRLQRGFERKAQQSAQSTDYLARRLVHPKRGLALQQKQVTQISQRLRRSIKQRQVQYAAEKHALAQRLQQSNPRRLLSQRFLELNQARALLLKEQKNLLSFKQQLLSNQGGILHSVSPLATLGRGYAIARDENQKISRDADQHQVGDQVSVQLAKGKLVCDVIETHSGD